MVIKQDRLRSWSEFTDQEYDETLAEMLSSLPPEELEIFVDHLTQEEDLVQYATDLEYDIEPVPMKDWLEDDYFMGDFTKTLYPHWKADLIELFSTGHYHVAYASGSLGSGKSFFASIAITRMLYEASCLRDPAASYGFAKGSQIGFGVFAPTETVARQATFEKIIPYVQGSPYFIEAFPSLNLKDHKRFKSNKIEFPKGLYIACGSSTDTVALGTNLMGAFVDELNFFKQSKKKKLSMDWRKDDKAAKLFDGLMRRMKNRFLKRGKLPGVLIGASSKQTVDSLMEKFIQDAIERNDKFTFVRDRSLIELRRGEYSDRNFRVVVGDENFKSQIIPNDADMENYKDACVVEIPEDFRHDFELDPDSALRDLAGISTLSVANFVSNVAQVNAIVDHSRKHPFFCARMDNSMDWDSRSHYQMNWGDLCRIDDEGNYSPKKNPHVRRYVHFDPAKSGDAFGLAIVHVAGLIKVKKDGSDFIEYQPVFDVDFMLRIIGTPEREVLFRNVRRIVYDFQDHGYYFSCITMDSYQTTEMHQSMQSVGYNTEYLSVDTSREPYVYLRRAIYENRVTCYPHPCFLEELKKLEDDVTMIDHPQGFHKDVADAVCGAIFRASQDVTMSETIIEEGESFIPKDEKETEKEYLYQHSEDDHPKKVYRKKSQTVDSTYKKPGQEHESRYDDNILDVIDFG